MLKGIQLTLMAGLGIPQAVERKVLDALLEATVTVSTKTISGFQLKFRLSQRSPLHTIFLLSGGGFAEDLPRGPGGDAQRRSGDVNQWRCQQSPGFAGFESRRICADGHRRGPLPRDGLH